MVEKKEKFKGLEHNLKCTAWIATQNPFGKASDASRSVSLFISLLWADEIRKHKTKTHSKYLHSQSICHGDAPNRSSKNFIADYNFLFILFLWSQPKHTITRIYWHLHRSIGRTLWSHGWSPWPRWSTIKPSRHFVCRAQGRDYITEGKSERGIETAKTETGERKSNGIN